MVFSCAICSEGLERNPATNPGDVLPSTQNGAAKVSSTPCGHVFHTFCIRKWLSGNMLTSNSCPCCRKQVPRAIVLPLFPDSYDDSMCESQPGSSPIDDATAQTYNRQAEKFEQEIRTLKAQVQTQKEDIQNNNKLYEMQCDEFLKMKEKFEREQDRSEHFLLKWKKYESYQEKFEDVSKTCRDLEQEIENYKYIKSHLDLVECDIEADLRHFAKHKKEDVIRNLGGLKIILQKEVVSMTKKQEQDRLENGALIRRFNQAQSQLRKCREEEHELRGVIDKLNHENKNLLKTQQVLKKQLAAKSNLSNSGSKTPKNSGATATLPEESPEINNNRSVELFADFLTPPPAPKVPTKRLNQTICISDDEEESTMHVDLDVGLMKGHGSNALSSANIESLVNGIHAQKKSKQAKKNTAATAQSTSSQASFDPNECVLTDDEDDDSCPTFSTRIRSNIPGVPLLTPMQPTRGKYQFQKKRAWLK